MGKKEQPGGRWKGMHSGNGRASEVIFHVCGHGFADLGFS